MIFLINRFTFLFFFTFIGSAHAQECGKNELLFCSVSKHINNIIDNYGMDESVKIISKYKTCIEYISSGNSNIYNNFSEKEKAVNRFNRNIYRASVDFCANKVGNYEIGSDFDIEEFAKIYSNNYGALLILTPLKEREKTAVILSDSLLNILMLPQSDIKNAINYLGKENPID
jgi:hypothetical protein